ncbi:F-box/kelch-repeat protein At3g23880-like [Mercurialis annua]|uniref:F-box/kelch-repeat protein At3g23880-like n=1 Tax=Mercurialis annua TaxID=3986 RepID=UPI002160D538|nr:F-box/kelch-repeat protein At3g23880-like [Mercurialis annua]
MARDNLTKLRSSNQNTMIMKKTKKMSGYSPEEVLVQILSRLRVKSILKFSCVCKLWNCIIKTPHFISAFSSNSHSHYFLLCPAYYCSEYYLNFDNKDLDEYMSLHPPFNRASYFTVIGSSNGLVCFGTFSYSEFIIWNPSIRKSLLIRESNFLIVSFTSQKLCGFGFDSRTNDYKLLVARFLADSISEVLLYSLNFTSWKKITNVACKCREDINWLIDPSFVDGRFYWPIIAETKNVVLVFDLRDEMF